MNRFPSTGQRVGLRVLVLVVAIATIVGIVMVLSACDMLFGADDSSGPSEGDQRQRTMRAQDILDGILGDMVGPVLGLHGLTVEAVSLREGSEQSWDVVFDTYSPPGELFTVDGTIEIDVSSDSTSLTVSASTPGGLVLSDHPSFSALSIDGMTATWDEGFNPGDNGDPDTVTGTFRFRISGSDEWREHDAEALIAALDQGEDYDGDIPKEKVKLAGGPLQIIGLVLQYFHMGPQHGLSVSVGLDNPWWATMTFSNFSPPGDDGQANGALRIEVPSESPFTVDVYTTSDIVITEPQRGTTTVSLDATATWADDTNPSNAPPESITGTITVNGVVYDIENLGRLPELFRTSEGNFEQHFKDFAWRPATDDPGAAWARFSYLRFEIAPDGRSHTLFHLIHAGNPGGELNFAGPLMWDSGSPDAIWFGDDQSGRAFEYEVREYCDAHLHLRIPWGSDGTREFLFSAGINSLTGVVVHNDPAWSEGGNQYHAPISEVTVQLFRRGENADPLAFAITDDRGVFVFPDLDELPGVSFPLDVDLMVEDYLVDATHFMVSGPNHFQEFPHSLAIRSGAGHNAFVMVSE